MLMHFWTSFVSLIKTLPLQEISTEISKFTVDELLIYMNFPNVIGVDVQENVYGFCLFWHEI